MAREFLKILDSKNKERLLLLSRDELKEERIYALCDVC
jgi:hypothetical protein